MKPIVALLAMLAGGGVLLTRTAPNEPSWSCIGVR